jgi:hypothetical protein
MWREVIEITVVVDLFLVPTMVSCMCARGDISSLRSLVERESFETWKMLAFFHKRTRTQISSSPSHHQSFPSDGKPILSDASLLFPSIHRLLAECRPSPIGIASVHHYLTDTHCTLIGSKTTKKENSIPPACEKASRVIIIISL